MMRAVAAAYLLAVAAATVGTHAAAVGGHASNSRDALALARSSRATGDDVYGFFNMVFSGVEGQEGDYRWKLDEGRLSSTTATSICDCSNACWEEVTQTCDGFYYATQTGECVLFTGLANGIAGPPLRFEAEDTGTASYSFKLEADRRSTVHEVLQECATTTTSTSTSMGSTTATTTATTTTCETTVMETLASAPDGYELLHLGNLDEGVDLQFKTDDIRHILGLMPAASVDECATKCTGFAQDTCDRHTSPEDCSSDGSCMYDSSVGKYGGCRATRCADHNGNPTGCATPCVYSSDGSKLCQAGPDVGDGAQCLTTATAACSTNATDGLPCRHAFAETRYDRCDCERGNGGDCSTAAERASGGLQMACEGFSYDVCSGECRVFSQIFRQGQGQAESAPSVEAAGRPTLSYGRTRATPPALRTADCTLFTHAHAVCGSQAYCAKGGSCAACAACTASGDTYDGGLCPAKCFGAPVTLTEGQSWPIGLDAGAAAGSAAPALIGTADKCSAKEHKFIRRANAGTVSFADGGDVAVSTFTKNMGDALKQLVERINDVSPTKRVVLGRIGTNLMYAQGRAADVTIIDLNPAAAADNATLLAELSAAAAISGFDHIEATGPTTVHVRVRQDECKVASDVNIVVDTSSGLSKASFQAALSAASSIAGTFDAGAEAWQSRIGVFSFAASATKHASVSQNLSGKDIAEALGGISFQGGAADGAAALEAVLVDVQGNTPRAHAQQNVVVITTRRTLWSPEAIKASASLRALGISVHILEVDGTQGTWTPSDEAAKKVASKDGLFSSAGAVAVALCRYDPGHHSLSLTEDVDMSLAACQARTFVQPGNCKPKDLVVRLKALERSASFSVSTTASGGVVQSNGEAFTGTVQVKKGDSVKQRFSRDAAAGGSFVVTVFGSANMRFEMLAWADVVEDGEIEAAVTKRESDAVAGATLINLPTAEFGYTLLSTEYADTFKVTKEGVVSLKQSLNATTPGDPYVVHFKVGSCAAFRLTVNVADTTTTTTTTTTETTVTTVTTTTDGSGSDGSGSGLDPDPDPSGSGSDDATTPVKTTTTATTTTTTTTTEEPPVTTTTTATTATTTTTTEKPTVTTTTTLGTTTTTTTSTDAPTTAPNTTTAATETTNATAAPNATLSVNVTTTIANTTTTAAPDDTEKDGSGVSGSGSVDDDDENLIKENTTASVGNTTGAPEYSNTTTAALVTLDESGMRETADEDYTALYIGIPGAVVFITLCIVIYIVYYKQQKKKQQQTAKSIDVESAGGIGIGSASTVVISNKIYKPKKAFEPAPVSKGYTQDASLGGRPVTVAAFSPERDFMLLDKNEASPDDLPGSMETLMYANRYRNVLPNKHSRVPLRQLGNDPLTTYINANYIRAFDGTPDWYIASQGPKPETMIDFWRMIWERNTHAIVMTTGITEGGRTKCAQYWPDEVADPNGGKAGQGVLECGDYTITNHSRKRINNIFLFSRLELQFNNQGNVEKREIGHFWYDTWPDHGAPDRTEGVTDMLQAVTEYSEGGPQQPWVVHCSAGIGRTGTFIGTDMGMHFLNTCGEANVREIIQHMREDRGGTVQTPIQAQFVHAALQTYARHFNEKNGLVSEYSADVPIKPVKTSPVSIFDPKTKAKRNVDCPADEGLRVTVDGFDAPGVVRFTGHHATDFEIGSCVGVVFDTPIGDMDGITAGHRYFECPDGYGSVVSCDDVSVDYGPEAKGATAITLERATAATDFGIEFHGAETAGDAAEYGYGVYISSVSAGSIAERAGLRKGSQVTKINGVSCIKFIVPDIAAEMQKAGTTAKLEVRENSNLVDSYDKKRLYDAPASDGESEYSDTDSIDGLFALTDLLKTPASQRVYVTGAPMWLHDPTSRTETETLLAKAGLQDGHFMARRRYQESSFSLSVVVSNTVTHHLIVEDEDTGDLNFDGDWKEQPVKGCTTLNDFVRCLADPDSTLDKSVWPTPLTHFVPKSTTSTSNGPFTVPFRVRKTQPKREAPAKEDAPKGKDDDSAPALKTVQVWTGISRDEADNMLIQSGATEGAWLTRTTLKVGSFDLTVVHGGAPAHHLLEQDATGQFLLNRQHYGEFTELDDVVRELCTNPPESWPLTLSMDKQYTAIPYSIGETVSAPFSEDGKNYDGIIVDMLVGDGNEESVARVSWVGHLSDFDDLVPIGTLKPATGETNPFFYLVGQPVEKLREDASLSRKQLQDAKAERLQIMHEARTGANLTFKLLGERVRSATDDLGLKIENKGFGNFIARVSKLAVDFHGYGGKLSPGMRIVSINGKDVEKATGKECRKELKTVQAAVARGHHLHGPYVVDISREDILANNGKVGLSFASVQNETGNYVTTTKGPAAKSGLLKEGLKIASINGQDVTNASKDVVRQLLQSRQALRIVAAEDLEGYARLLESHPQAHVIVKTLVTEEAIQMNGGKIGMSFVNNANGVFITKVSGAAARAGTLAEGHQLLMINGNDVTRMEKKDCMQLLKSAPNIELMSKRDPLGYFVVKLAKDQKEKAKLMAELPKEVELVVKLDTQGYKQHVEHGTDAKAGAGGSTADAASKSNKKKTGDKKKAATFVAKIAVSDVQANAGKIGLGLVTLDGKVYLKKVSGAAAASGVLKPGHQLLKINDVSVKKLGTKECTQVLKQHMGADMTIKTKDTVDKYTQLVEAKEGKKSGKGPASAPATRQVTVTKGAGKLGISLCGPVDARDPRSGLFITKVRDASPAKGILPVHSRLYAVDGNDVSGLTKSACLEFFKANTTSTITFVISATPDEAGLQAFEAGGGAPPAPKQSAPAPEPPKIGIEAEPYFHGPIPRPAAEAILGAADPSTFLVRASTRGDDSYAISVLNNTGKVQHFKVSQSQAQVGQWELKSFNDGKNFKDVPTLVEYYKGVLDNNPSSGFSLTHPAPKAKSSAPPKSTNDPASAGQPVYDTMAPDSQSNRSSQPSPTREVIVNKGDSKLGLSLAGPSGGADTRTGIFVSKVKDESPCKGLIPPMSRIFAIDGVDLTNGTKADAVNAAKVVGAVVKFVISATPDQAGFSTFNAAKASATRTVIINKGPNKLGMSLCGPSDSADTRVGIFVTKVKDDSPCRGQIAPMSRIYAINGMDVKEKSKADAVNIMKTVGDVVEFVISATPDEIGFAAFNSAKSAGAAATSQASPVNAPVTPTTATQETRTITISAEQIAASGKVGLKIITSEGSNYVKSTSGAAKATKQVKPGWKIVSVNGQDMTTSGRKPCVAALKSEGPLEVVVRKDARYDEILELIAKKALEAKSSDKSSGKGSAKSSGKSSGKSKASGKGSGKTSGKAAAVDITVRVALPMGLSFDGSGAAGCFVTKCKPGSNAEATGKIVPGLRFIAVEGKAVQGADKKAITALIKACSGSCTLTLKKDISGFRRFQETKSLTQASAPIANSAPVPTNPGELAVTIEMPMGMSFDNAPDLGTFVTKTKPGSNAERNNVRPGMRFMTINGTSILGMGKKQVTEIIKASPGGCAITFVDDKQAYATFNAYVEKKRQDKLARAAPPQPVQQPPPPQTAAATENPYADMGRLKLVKLCRDRGIEYQSIAKDQVAMQKKLMEHDSATGGGPPPLAPANTTPTKAANPKPAVVSDDYDNMGKFQLIKECRARGIDYSSAGKDIQALKALLRA